MSRCAPWLLSLVLTPWCLLVAADADATPTRTPAGAEAPTAEDTASEELTGLLPSVPSVVTRDGGVWWDDGKGSAYRITAVNEAGASLDTEIGLVTVAKPLIAEARLDCLAALPRLIATAQAGTVERNAGLALAEGVMTGIHLRAEQLVVLPDAVLRKQETTAPVRATELEALQSAVTAATSALDASGLDSLGRKAVTDFLTRLPLSDQSRKFEFDEIFPTFARRVVRHGWAEKHLDAATGKPLAAALETCAVMREVTVFSGGESRLSEVKDAFGVGGWVLRTPTRVSFARPHPGPMYAFGHAAAGLLLVVDLPAGADPLHDGAKATAARLFQGGKRLVSWSRSDGFQCELATWRAAVPEHGRHTEDDVASGFLPPHLVITDLDGDVRLLASAHGLLVPPQDPSASEAERFLADAATALPDAAHLDLVGEYLFYYVYDSPDSRNPQLLGNRQVKGDIHQTAVQTMATVAGGMVRGDCDDLAELYQAICEHQGRTAHIISLPQHAALAYAEQQADEWHVFILQTGQPREFSDPKLPEALRTAYLSFDAGETFDPNGLGLLLRFTGENTRGAWRLSWRIFSEPAYAKIMIDVQRDWHFSTYQRGIAKMKQLIADGDDDTANYRELSGLYSFTGQDALAVEYHRQAIARTDDAESNLYTASELVNHLFDSGDAAGARAEVTRLLDDELPALQEKLGNRVLQFGIQLASYCNDGKDHELAERVIMATLHEELSAQVQQAAAYCAGKQFNAKRWEALSPLRHLQQMYVGICLATLEGRGAAALQGDTDLQQLVRSVQVWLDGVAFHDVDEPDDVLARYATAGEFYAAVMGEDQLLALLAAAPLADDRELAHAERVGGLAQVSMDLPWIKTAPSFWYARLARMFRKDATTFDREHALLYGRMVAEASANARKLGIEDTWLDGLCHQAAVITALIAEDEPALRARLHFVTEKDDKRLRDDTAQWLGDAARYCSPEWYARVLKAWVEECDYKPKYFWIAWRAALNHAPERALEVARLAAKRFSDDPAFSEELRYMEALFGGTTK